MISDFFIAVGVGVANLLAGLGLDWLVPEWLEIDALMIAKIFAMMGSMNVWFPVPLIIVVIGATVLAWFTGFGIKFSRSLLSHVPFFGGSGN